eukprot:TRINITY_DN25599_c0_g1_i1.p1 TRINITY_DN25599_c0_g1~~TRINITY_DN25599_c0_g1_i1.p1  ORF type:complete len:109 (-),score=7.00 TRINITY_DN25599_c0_g1_i1:191-517(-)
MSDISENDEDDDIAARPLIARVQNDEDSEPEMQDNIDPNLYKRLKEANQFHKFPKDVSLMTAEDIAQLPASMQFEIMSKRRELLRSKDTSSNSSKAADCGPRNMPRFS